MKLLDVVKNGNVVTFDSYRQGLFYYNIIVDNNTYQFTVPLEDIGTATLPNKDKASFYMRWIQPALKNGTFIKIS